MFLSHLQSHISHCGRQHRSEERSEINNMSRCQAICLLHDSGYPAQTFVSVPQQSSRLVHQRSLTAEGSVCPCPGGVMVKETAKMVKMKRTVQQVSLMSFFQTVCLILCGEFCARLRWLLELNFTLMLWTCFSRDFKKHKEERETLWTVYFLSCVVMCIFCLLLKLCSTGQLHVDWTIVVLDNYNWVSITAFNLGLLQCVIILFTMRFAEVEHYNQSHTSVVCVNVMVRYLYTGLSLMVLMRFKQSDPQECAIWCVLLKFEFFVLKHFLLNQFIVHWLL